MGKLIIELDIEQSDWEKRDVATFLNECNEATGISVKVGRSVSEEESDIVRSFSLSTENFKAYVKESDNVEASH